MREHDRPVEPHDAHAAMIDSGVPSSSFAGAGSGDGGPARAPAIAPAVPRELILASAGSGKTFRISSRIIGLLAAGEEPEAILASTFTRKAAGEILGRVLVRLAEAALDPEKARELSEHAALAADAVPLDCDRCLDLLAGLTRGLHRLNIGTLDAFFVRAAQTFAHDLGLPPAWGIADEPTSRRIRAEALQEVLRQADPGTVVELVRLANRGDVARSVHEALLSRIGALYEVYHQVDPAADAWTLYPGLEGGDASEGGGVAGSAPYEAGTAARHGAAHGTVYGAGGGGAEGAAGRADGDHAPARGRPATGASGVAARERLADAIAALEAPRTAKGTPNASWAKALAAAADAVRRGDWEGFVGLTLTQKVLTGDDTYSRVAIPGDVLAVFGDALEVACRVIGRRLSAQIGAIGRLVAHFDEAYGRLLYREGAYRFDDVTRLLGGPSALGARPDLDYRLDARMRHLLLDEFQDTSVPQWSALESVVDALLGGGGEGRAGGDAEVAAGTRADGAESAAVGSRGAAVVVADPKQSIYGWRGARPELVHAVGTRYGLDREVLARSWRSSQVVLDAVNDVFESIASNPALDEVGREVAADWARAYAHHEAARGLPGHVRMVVGPDDGGNVQHRPKLLARAAELVRELREEAPGFGIGVLTRENKAVTRLIHELRRLGIEASEEGGNPLTDSPAVASVLALLHLSDHPDDRIARYHVAKTPVGEAVGYRDPGDGGGARRLAQRFRERLLRDGYGATLNDLAGRLLPACGERDRRRLMQLVELAYRYDPRATLRPTDFVRVVESERIEDPTAASVRVMTIHQSKGLEFDIVVLPELDGAIFRGGGAAVLPYREDPTGPITRVYPYIGKELLPLFPEIEAAYRQHRGAIVRDALSTLYVAMTRARHALHLVVKPDSGDKVSAAMSPAMIVRHALVPGVVAVEGDVLYEAGDPRWHERIAPPEPEQATRADEVAVEGAGGGASVDASTAAAGAAGTAALSLYVRLRDAAPRRLRMLPRRTPSELEGGMQVDLRQRLRLENAAALEHGSLVHAWCEEIVWLDDGLPDDDRLLTIARRVAPRLEEVEVRALAARFREWMARPEIAAALRREAYPADARVERERRFIHRAGDAIVEGIIDRLVVWGADGRVEGAEVLDYKTDALDPGDAEALAERVAFYRPQIAAYREAVAGMYGLDLDRVGAKLLFLGSGVVVVSGGPGFTF